MYCCRLSSQLALSAVTGLLVSVTTLLAQSGLTLAPAGEISTRSAGERVFSRAWSGRTLLQVERNDTAEPIILATDKDGKREEITFRIPGSASTRIYGAAAGIDGSIAVFGPALTNDSRGASFVAWISPDRQRQTVIRTTPYKTHALAISRDGTIWTVGSIDYDTSSDVLRRYDTSGTMLGSYLPRSAIKSSMWVAQANTYLMASRDRIGWYAGGYEYIEVSLDGQLINHFSGVPLAKGESTQGAALSDNNDVLLCKFDSRTKEREILTLDRASRRWRPLGLPEGCPDLTISGFDGNILVAFPIKRPNVVQFYKLTALQSKP